MDMEMAMEVEDDVFFEDLSKQIALLIMDDDDGGDDNEEAFPEQRRPSFSLQAFSHASQTIVPSPPFFYDQACKREIRGTGVFIPRSSPPRRKNRSGRSRPPDKPRVSASAAAASAAATAATAATGSHKSCNNYYYRNSNNGLKKHNPQ